MAVAVTCATGATPTSVVGFAATPVSVAIGTDHAGDTIVLVFQFEDTDALTGVTLGGNAFTLAGTVPKGNTDTTIEIWYGLAPAGTTANVGGTSDGGANPLQVAVYRVTGNDPTPTDYDQNASAGGVSISLTGLTVPASGAGIIGSGNDTNAAIAWTGATVDFDVACGARFSGATTTTAGTNTITADGATDDQSIAGIAFGPAAAGGSFKQRRLTDGLQTLTGGFDG